MKRPTCYISKMDQNGGTCRDGISISSTCLFANHTISQSPRLGGPFWLKTGGSGNTHCRFYFRIKTLKPFTSQASNSNFSMLSKGPDSIGFYWYHFLRLNILVTIQGKDAKSFVWAQRRHTHQKKSTEKSAALSEKVCVHRSDGRLACIR